ncbi:oxygenase MpaB family protein [Algiphilus sp.]|uniref:oxygenase MpaB family protein n=1 Tax=Algiphilus sp. TaxID=1872431 RepID=UPI002A691617|nr:DUF2236 domain-containing protein [Pseudomonadota bacterium]
MSPADSASALPASDDQPAPRPLGPDSQTWADFGSLMLHLMLPQAFVLQVAHPTIDAGVGQHSVYKTDPWGRIQRSHQMLWPVVYARPETAIRKGVALRAYHRAIKGVDRHGRPYHALEPEAYGWVHMTGFDATVRMHALFGTALSDDARREAFQEWRRMGLILGLREQDLPATEADYWSHLHRMIDERLTMGDVACDLLDVRAFSHYPRPPGSRIPKPLWRLLLKAVAPAVRRMVVGTAHPRFRSRFQLRWTRWDATWFAVYLRALRLILRLLPERWRYIPQARAAMLDARQNPEAYLWERDVVKRQGGAVPRVLPSSPKGHC